jgi:hypothetical protein
MSVAAAGHVKAQGLLGSVLRNRGKISDAILWLGKAANAGDEGALVELGVVHVWSGDAYRDYRIAYVCWREAARVGNGVALANLGVLYANGFGVDRSPTKAFLLAATSGSAGNPQAQSLMKDFAPLLKQCSPSAIHLLEDSLKELESRANAGDVSSLPCWVIDNLDSLTSTYQTVKIILFGNQRDYNALVSLLQQHGWPQQTLTDGIGQTFVVRQTRISRDFCCYDFCVSVPEEEIATTFRNCMNRMDLIGIKSPSKVEATDLQGHNLIYW